MNLETVILARSGRVATITINRPDALNALTDQVYRDLIAAFRAARLDKDVGCVILTGSGRAFCAGADLKARRDDLTMTERKERHEWILQEFLLPMLNFPKPVIAVVNGVAAGAGCSIAQATDMILASEDASFVHNFVKLGLIPDLGGYYLLSRMVGPSAAKEVYFTGRRVSAEEARALGMVLQTWPAAELMTRAQELATRIAENPPMALSMTKALLNQSSSSPIEALLQTEAMSQALAYASPEFEAVVSAFRKGSK